MADFSGSETVRVPVDVVGIEADVASCIARARAEIATIMVERTLFGREPRVNASDTPLMCQSEGLRSSGR